MKKKLIYVSVMLVFLLTFSCQQSDYEVYLDSPIVWKSQFDKVLTEGNSILEESGLQMMGYEIDSKVITTEDIQNVKNVILSGSQYVPLYTPMDLSSLSVITISEIPSKMKEIEIAGIEYNINGAKLFLDTVVKAGQNVVNIDWVYNGKKFSTKAIVDFEEGLIYDNILTNIFIIKEDKPVDEFIDSNHVSTLAIDQCIITPGGMGIWPTSHLIERGVTADWLWGSERGKASVTHFVEGYTNNSSGSHKAYLTCSSVEASCYITLGTCDAKITIHEANYGLNGTSYVHWSYFLASPTISISMSYSVSGYSFSGGTGLGSVAKNTGSEYFSAAHWLPF